MPNSSSDVPILVTGGAGYIGSHAVFALRDAGREVVVLDDLSNGDRRALPPDVELVEGDIADSELVAGIIDKNRIESILHFAGSMLVAESMTDPLKYYRNNSAASRTLIETAIGHGIRNFVFSSTAAVYGRPEKVPVAENAATVPINPYGWSKLMTEQILADAGRAHGLRHVSLRYFNVAGADPGLRTGQRGKSSTHIVKIVAECATAKRNHVEIYGQDYDTADGTCVRDYIHVSDLAQAHVAAIDALERGDALPAAMNCGYGCGFSVIDVLDAADRVQASSIKRVTGERRPGDPDTLVADNHAIHTALDWRPRLADLDTIVRDAIAWERHLRTEL